MSMRFCIVVFLTILTGISVSLAQLSPGKLSTAHAELEGIENCTRCHTARKAVDALKCLDCHTVLKDRIEAKKGLHANPEFQQCQKCHHEHFGRDFQLIHWEKGQPDIDHAKTGWQLLGKHQALECRDCHTAKYIPPAQKRRLTQQKKDLNRTFLGLDTRCLSCHQDEHRGQLATDCLNCHTMDGWKPASRFDHNNARFRLTGAHAQVTCAACHSTRRDNRYPDNPTYVQFTGLAFRQCSSCHQDVHRGRFGANCQKCHTTRSWQQVNTAAFDHNRTRFPLIGQHQKVACQKCHQGKGRQRFRGLKFEQCRDCHQDYHRGQFSSKLAKADCDVCHSEQGFRPSKFSIIHHQKTRFPLTGAHGAVLCRDCHQPITTRQGKTLQFSFSSLACTQCHRNIHGKSIQAFTQADGCQSCHSTDAWAAVTFDHNRTDFPLTGAHQQVACTQCHQSTGKGTQQRLVFSQASKLCQACHKEPHRQQFAKRVTVRKRTVLLTRCERCHTTTDWHTLTFDHNRDSRFKLEGAHAEVACQQCHPTVKGNPAFVRYKPLDSRCQSCHGNSREKQS